MMKNEIIANCEKKNVESFISHLETMVSLTLSPALRSCTSGIIILISSLPLAFHAKGVDLTMCKKILNHL